jgi:predicted deacetylase
VPPDGNTRGLGAAHLRLLPGPPAPIGGHLSPVHLGSGARECQHTIAVAIHGIEPATFERCALIRDWLMDHEIDRVTLLVIPARDMHPVGERSPEMVSWLGERRRAGDVIAQHGFRHGHGHGHISPRRLFARSQGHRGGEFLGLDLQETQRAVHAGWRVMKLAGIEPDGFVAPSYAYTPALRETLRRRFRWWAELLRVRTSPAGAGGREPLAPAWSMTPSSSFGRFLAPTVISACALVPTMALRLDVHPSDLRHPRHMLALERVLERCAAGRKAVTYQDLAER